RFACLFIYRNCRSCNGFAYFSTHDAALNKIEVFFIITVLEGIFAFMQVYVDNAATTPMDPEVIAVMTETMKNDFGNPSSIHARGRQVRTIIEKARKTVATLLNASPAEIFFTSGGTEANNMALVRGIKDHGIKYAITSPLEHHAVLHTLEELEDSGQIQLAKLRVDALGRPDLDQLEHLLASQPRTLVSLMHANNEIGTMTDIEMVSAICEKYQALFHAD